MNKFLKDSLDLLLQIASVIFSGYVISTLWSLFIVPTFGFVALNIPSAIGVMLVAGYVTKQFSYADYIENKNEDAQKWHRWMRFVRPAMLLAVGYIVSLFM